MTLRRTGSLALLVSVVRAAMEDLAVDAICLPFYDLNYNIFNLDRSDGTYLLTVRESERARVTTESRERARAT